jgi:hypothetical protein
MKACLQDQRRLQIDIGLQDVTFVRLGGLICTALIYTTRFFTRIYYISAHHNLIVGSAAVDENETSVPETRCIEI